MSSPPGSNSLAGDEGDELRQALLHRLLGVLCNLGVARQRLLHDAADVGNRQEAVLLPAHRRSGAGMHSTAAVSGALRQCTTGWGSLSPSALRLVARRPAPRHRPWPSAPRSRHSPAALGPADRLPRAAPAHLGTPSPWASSPELSALICGPSQFRKPLNRVAPAVPSCAVGAQPLSDAGGAQPIEDGGSQPRGAAVAAPPEPQRLCGSNQSANRRIRAVWAEIGRLPAGQGWQTRLLVLLRC